MYTETMLKKLNKPDLLKIAADNGINIPDGTTIPKIVELILEKGCPVPNTDEDQPPADDTDEGVQKFSKEEVLKSNWYSHRRVLLSGLLEDGKTYSYATVDMLIKNNLDGKR